MKYEPLLCKPQLEDPTSRKFSFDIKPKPKHKNILKNLTQLTSMSQP